MEKLNINGSYHIYKAPLDFDKVVIKDSKDPIIKKINVGIIWHYLVVRPIHQATKNLMTLFSAPIL